MNLCLFKTQQRESVLSFKKDFFTKEKPDASRVLQVAHKVHSPSPFTPSGCLRSTHRPEGYRPEGYRKPRNRIS